MTEYSLKDYKDFEDIPFLKQTWSHPSSASPRKTFFADNGGQGAFESSCPLSQNSWYFVKAKSLSNIPSYVYS